MVIEELLRVADACCLVVILLADSKWKPFDASNFGQEVRAVLIQARHVCRRQAHDPVRFLHVGSAWWMCMETLFNHQVIEVPPWINGMVFE